MKLKDDEFQRRLLEFQLHFQKGKQTMKSISIPHFRKAKTRLVHVDLVFSAFRAYLDTQLLSPALIEQEVNAFRKILVKEIVTNKLNLNPQGSNNE